MKNVADLYPLTPMQRVMLLHSLGVGEGTDTLFHQFVYTLEGPLESEPFQSAWAEVVRRHPALRTMFAWDGLDDPLQIVRDDVQVPCEVLDWSAYEDDREVLDAWLRADRARGFELNRAPLIRVALMRLTAERHRFVWSSHHLVLDRWCIAPLLEEWSQEYARRVRLAPSATSLHEQGPLPGSAPDSAARPGRFRDYVAWVQGQDHRAAREYWRRNLAGCRGAQRTCLTAGVEFSGAPRVEERRLDRSAGDRLRARARELRLTPSIVVQAAWSLVLQRIEGAEDVVFGLTVAGRPPNLPRVESTIGSFISNLPVRVRFDRNRTVRAWLQSLHRGARERAPFEFLSVNEVHEVSGLSMGEVLFDSLVVWLAPVDSEQQGTLRWVAHEGSLETPWPLTLSVADLEQGFRFQLATRGREVDLDGYLEALVAAIEQLIQGDPERAVGELTALTPSSGSGDAASEELPRGEPAGGPAYAPHVGGDTPAAAGREQEELAMLEDLVLAECRSLLGVEGLTLEDNFFEVGGNSLLAAHLHSQLEQITARKMPVLSLFQSPSLGEMARFLARGDWPVRGQLVRTIRGTGSRPTLFCLSSPEVNSIGYVMLARHLSEDQPVALVQTPPDSDEVLRMAISAIPSLAQRYVEGIRGVQPEGPYRLFGMCDGALIALEMARLLKEQGQVVDFVGVLNTSSLGTLSSRYALRRVQRRFEYYGERLSQLIAQPWPERRAELARVWRARGGEDSASPGPDPPAPREGEAASEATTAEGPSLEDIDLEWRTLDRPGGMPARDKYPGTVTVFRIRKMPYWRVRDPQLGWGQHAEEIDLVRLDEHPAWPHRPDRRPRRVVHLGLLREPDVRHTAAIVEEKLRALPGGDRA